MREKKYHQGKMENIPLTINYHMWKFCNFKCKYCFQSPNSFKKNSTPPLDFEEMKKGYKKMMELKNFNKINFVGGEPFCFPKILGNSIKYCKKNLQMPRISIVSNGYYINKEWMEEHGKYIDILGISIDSFRKKTCDLIGRSPKIIKKIFDIKKWCLEQNILLKINTVVSKLNETEDMNEYIKEIDPFRWKVFKVHFVKNENDNPRIKKKFEITDKSFFDFVENNKKNIENKLIFETNELMSNSYIMLDKKMRFIKMPENEPTKSITEEGIDINELFKELNWDKKSFVERKGIY